MFRRMSLITLALVFCCGLSSIANANNPCSDDQFLNPVSGLCEDLLGVYTGFDDTWLSDLESNNSSEIVVSSCTESALDSAIDTAKSQNGGVILLPDCTIEITSGKTIPSNTVLQGRGENLSTISARGNLSTWLQTRGSTNVVLRDFTFDGNHISNVNILLNVSRNILVENVTSTRAKTNNMRVRYTQDFTIRYSTFQNAQTHHGIAINDCTQNERVNMFPDLADCTVEYDEYRNGSDVGPMWTVNQLIHSNHIYNNPVQGINNHGMQAEIVGNHLEKIGFGPNGGSGFKLVDASNIWIYKNYLEDVSHAGFFSWKMQEIDWRTAQNIYIIKNTFENVSRNLAYLGQPFINRYGMYEDVFFEDIYFLYNDFDHDNYFSSNAVTPTGSLFICADSQEATSIDFQVHPPSILDASVCSSVDDGDLSPLLPTIPSPTTEEVSCQSSDKLSIEQQHSYFISRTNVNQSEDRLVDILDYTVLIEDFGRTSSGDNYINSDVNCDQVVNILDYTLLIQSFLAF